MSYTTIREIIKEEIKKANLFPTLEDRCVDEICNVINQYEGDTITYGQIALLCMGIKKEIEKLQEVA